MVAGGCWDREQGPRERSQRRERRDSHLAMQGRGSGDEGRERPETCADTREPGAQEGSWRLG